MNALLEDRLVRLWVGTHGGLDLFDRDQNRFVHYRHDPSNPYSLSDDLVLSLYEDRSGVLWVGTTHGLALVDVVIEDFTVAMARMIGLMPPERKVSTDGHRG